MRQSAEYWYGLDSVFRFDFTGQSHVWGTNSYVVRKCSLIFKDHDLGDDDRGTGYDVILWIEDAVFTKGFMAPKIRVHSANSSAGAKMELGIASIESRSSNST